MVSGFWSAAGFLFTVFFLFTAVLFLIILGGWLGLEWAYYGLLFVLLKGVKPLAIGIMAISKRCNAFN